MHTLAIVNEKGGTGKTTTAVNLAAALGEMGRRILLVDLDGQAASSRWLGVEEDSRLADAMVRGGGLEPLAEVMPGVSLAPASGKLDSISHDLRPTQGGQLRRTLAEIQDDYDHILIDCPPSLGNRLIGNALLAASHALVPVEPSILALDGLRMLLLTLEDVRAGFDHQIDLAGVVLCRYEARTRLSRLVMAELKRALPGRVFGSVIRETVRMQECPASGKSILEFAPSCCATRDYRALAQELVAGGPAAVGDEQVEGDLIAAGSVDDEERRKVMSFRLHAAHLYGGEDESGDVTAPEETEDLPAAGAPYQTFDPELPEEGVVISESSPDLGHQVRCEQAADEAETPVAVVPVSDEEAQGDEDEPREPEPPPGKHAKRRRFKFDMSAAAAALMLIFSVGVGFLLLATQNTPQVAEAEGRISEPHVVPQQHTQDRDLIPGPGKRPAGSESREDQPSQETGTSAADVAAPLPAADEETSAPVETGAADAASADEASVEQAATQSTPPGDDVTDAEQPDAAGEALAAVEQPAAIDALGDAAAVDRTNAGDAAADEQADGPQPTTKPAEPEAQTPAAPSPPPLKVSGILQGPNGPLAIINEQIVGVGDRIGEALIVEVGTFAVEVEFQGESFTLGVGETRSPAGSQPAGAGKDLDIEAE